MRSTVLIFALGCAASVAALPVDTTDPLTDLSISGPMVPVDPAASAVPAVPVVPTVPADATTTATDDTTSPIDGVGEDPLTGSAFLVTNGSADTSEKAGLHSAGVGAHGSARHIPIRLHPSSISPPVGRSAPAAVVPSASSTPPANAFALPGGALSPASASPIPTSTGSIASIDPAPGVGVGLGSILSLFNSSAFKRQVRTLASWRHTWQKRRVAEESA